ncbi:hypothetical protein F0U60_27010 [Archangium minus]|uniref:GHMP kinase N-terminal domain-containing protein n=1 Tax=Archangium minus TaxID=83450 RepID=A0ABY9WW65_9BACT|nr:hypothetical protein F0U60_27010 [Archangium minus]
MKTPWRTMCPGTFGELVQGRIAKRNFLVTLPISKFSRVTIPQSMKEARPSLAFSKCDRFIEALGQLLGRSLSCQFSIESQLARGKGLASSSADLTAVGTALLHSLEIDACFHSSLISRAAAQVEPTDGVMYPGINAYAQHECQLIENFGSFDFELAGVLLENEVDTVSYNSKSLAYTAQEEASFELAFGWAREGIRNKDLSLVGRASSLSAEINERFLPKREFKRARLLQARLGSPGLVVAHSGTAIGLLVPQGASAGEKARMTGELQSLYGLPAEIYSTWMAGPQLLSRPQRQLGSPVIYLRGKNRVVQASRVPQLSFGTVLMGAAGEFEGFAIDGNSSVEQLALAAEQVRQVFGDVEIETSHAC